MTDRPRTLRELRESGYRSVGVKLELRRNLLEKLRRREPIFPGIHGYDDTVLPEVENAILSQHDVLFLGLRGQAKTRMLRMLTNLLDETLPIVAGSEIHDDPYHPLSKFARDLIAEKGDDTPISWIGREERYHEKLATPDVTIADLIGEIDLIKHAEGRELANEDVLHFGLIPRSHRGIFCLNELPDLSPKIQVGLFNVLEERDVQIRGFPVRLNLDICMVFSANPEDYTNRGRIVTPLKDRIGSVVRTHYPPTRELGMVITAENAWTDRPEGPPVVVPKFVEEIVEEVARLARTSPHVNQASGVSTRMSIANYENVLSNAERRSVLHDESPVVCRISDLIHLVASARGKMELNLTEEPGQEDKLVVRLVEEAVKTVFDQHLDPKQFRPVVEYVEGGKTIEFGDHLSTKAEWGRIEEVRGLPKLVEQTANRLQPELAQGASAPEFLVSVAEFIFEGLHCHNRLNKKITAGRSKYGG